MITGIGIPISQSNAALPIVASQLERKTNALAPVGFQVRHTRHVFVPAKAGQVAAIRPSAALVRR